MSTFEILLWIVCIAVLCALITGGLALLIAMAIEVLEDVRRFKAWLRRAKWRGLREGGRAT